MNSETTALGPTTILRDLISGLVVFLVALPLCLGIALASGAELFSGLLSGIVGGLVVATVSGSQTSVSGPAAGLTAIVAAQIAVLGSFEAFLLAVALAGVLQIGFGILNGGKLSAFFPSSVIKGLLVAIGVILILKQIPHVVGQDSDPEGEMSFEQPDDHNTFSEIWTIFDGEFHVGAMVIGLLSLAFLFAWDRFPKLKNSLVPAPLLVVILGTAMSFWFRTLGQGWLIGESHLVQVPVASNVREFIGFLTLPDFAQIINPAIYVGAITIAVVASLETLLNLEAVDKIDPLKRNSPASRELIAQGCGNVVCGMIGGLPVTSVIIRGSVNVNSGGKTKLSAIFHGVLLLLAVAVFPQYMNHIPLSALAAILLATGFKLASPKLFKQMWQEGRYQFIPFIVTVVAIVRTDLLIGILIGLATAIAFILHSNLRRPIHRIVERHLDGDITHIKLANQVSFLNRAAIEGIFDEAPSGSKMLIDAAESDYIDPDVQSLIRDFANHVGPARGVRVNLVGFKRKYEFNEVVQFADFTTRELQQHITADQVIEILREGNRRFVDGQRLNRDLGRQVNATSEQQNPIAAILSCIDSRVPTELVFDLGVGDIFSVRVAGNIVGTKSLGSLEFAVAVSGVKTVVVLGHTRCGAVSSSVDLVSANRDAMSATGCQHLQSIVDEISPSIQSTLTALRTSPGEMSRADPQELAAFVDEVAKRNVSHSVSEILRRSDVIRAAVDAETVKVVGAIYNVATGVIEFYPASDQKSSE